MDVVQAPPVSLSEQPVAELLRIVEELTRVLSEENDMLRRGLLAGSAPMTARKLALNAAHAEAWREVFVVLRREPAAAAGLAERLSGPALRLKREARENARRLDSAIDATRLRMTSVVDAIRARDRERRPYSLDGTSAARPLPNRLRSQA